MSSLSVKLPLVRDIADGFLMIKDFPTLVKQNFKMLILTNPGERIMIPDFGVGIRQYLFENFSEVTYSRIENKIFEVDPFVSIDQSGVGELVELASSRGKKANKKLKLGICGEHGGDPQSIEFCSRNGLNYVSCSPFRVPVARLAAAQAELRR